MNQLPLSIIVFDNYCVIDYIGKVIHILNNTKLF